MGKQNSDQYFIDHMEDLLNETRNKNYFHLTNFLNLHEQYVLEDLATHYSDIEVLFNGGYSLAERKKAVLIPNDNYYFDNDFKILLYEINYSSKFGEISHNQILGSLMGLGYDRNKFGDIITNDRVWQFYVDSEIEDDLKLNFKKVGKKGINLSKIPLTKHLKPSSQKKSRTILTTSYRIDSVIATTLNISRQNAQDFFQKGNYSIIFCFLFY